MLRLLLFLLLVLSGTAHAQSGCTDPRARNYNSAATANDGSCQYRTTRARPVRKARLAAAVPETSALQYTDGALWTLNDGGNAPVLFRLDSATGQVQRQVRISNFENLDWEDLAADSNYLYIGDFGNNYGNRQDLRVLRVAKAHIAGTDSARAEAITFYYPDQTDFTPNLQRQNFDCEAFFYHNDSLHLFTKNWADYRTRYYTVPARPGRHAAHLKATFNTRGLVTAAALSPGSNSVALLGYSRKTGASFLWLLSDFPGTRFLAGNKRRLKLPHALRLGQAEGLCFVAPYRVFVTTERLPKRFTLTPQRLYSLDLRWWLGPAVGPSGRK